MATSADRAHRGGRLGTLWVPAAVVGVGWLVALTRAADYVNPDGTAYVGVARLWLEGDWSTAVNGYWGPLLSWLLVPLLAIGVPDLTALRLVLLAASLLSLVPLRSLAVRAGASETATSIVLVATAPFLVYAALFGLYADVLLTLALLLLCDQLFRADFVSTPSAAVLAGLWAGVAYLAKAYAVPVVLVAIPLGVALHALDRRVRDRGPLGRRWTVRLLRQGAVAFLAFGAVFALWAGTLTASYGSPTFSTSAGFNARLASPTSAGNPLNSDGIYVPERPDALSVWEEPSRLPVPVRTRGGSSQAQDVDERAERVERLVGHTRIVVGTVLRRGLPLAALAAVALVVAVRRRRLPRPALTGTLLTGLVSAAGLLVLLAIERYVWFTVLACVPAAAVGLDALTRSRPRLLLPLGALVAAVMAASAVAGLAPRFGSHSEVVSAHEALARAPGDGLTGTVAAADSWQETLHLCFRESCQYVGRPRAEQAAEAADELRDAGVARLVVWEADRDEIAGLPRGAQEPPEGWLLAVYVVGPDGLELERYVGADGP